MSEQQRNEGLDALARSSSSRSDHINVGSLIPPQELYNIGLKRLDITRWLDHIKSRVGQADYLSRSQQQGLPEKRIADIHACYSTNEKLEGGRISTPRRSRFAEHISTSFEDSTSKNGLSYVDSRGDDTQLPPSTLSGKWRPNTLRISCRNYDRESRGYPSELQQVVNEVDGTSFGEISGVESDLCITIANGLDTNANGKSCKVIGRNVNAEKSTLENEQVSQDHCLNCSSCNQTFNVRKSLLRHIRTVHRPKAFTCFQCYARFTRKDTRDRHETEQHTNQDGTVTCVSCGRYVGRRSFAEHLDSEVCRNAQVSTALADIQNHTIKFRGAEDDPFLAALRMLRLFGPDTANETLTYARLKLKQPHTQEPSTLLQYESCVTRLLIERISDPSVLSKSVGMAALLLGFMCLAGQRTWGGRAVTHFEGAAQLFRAYHALACECGDHRSCPLWSPFAPKDPEIGLLKRLLNDLGIDHKLLNVYSMEDEVAFANHLYGQVKF